MLSGDKVRELVCEAQKGSEEAKDALIAENSPLIKSIIKRFQGKGLEYDDLYQLGCLGFVKAIKNFDASFNVKFSTYVVPMVIGEIKRFMRDDGSIKVSRAIKNRAKQINLFVEKYASEHGSQPSLKIISKEFDMPESEVVFTMGSTRMPVSIYERGDYKDEKGQELLEKLPVEDRQEEIIDALQLRTAIEGLPERDRKVIMLRYFRDMTQSEVAGMLGVSQVQVSRIENRIMRAFRRDLTG